MFVFAFVPHAFTHIYFLSLSNIQNANIACAHATFSLQFSSFSHLFFSRFVGYSVLRLGLFSSRQCKPHRNQTREMDLILDFCEHFAPPEYHCVRSTLHTCMYMYENEEYMIENRSGITVSLFSKHKVRIRTRMRVCD